MQDCSYEFTENLNNFNIELGNYLHKFICRKITLHDKFNLLEIEQSLRDNVETNLCNSVYKKVMKVI